MLLEFGIIKTEMDQELKHHLLIGKTKAVRTSKTMRLNGTGAKLSPESEKKVKIQVCTVDQNVIAGHLEKNHLGQATLFVIHITGFGKIQFKKQGN